ncbi:MAG: LacI family DNA-binding transcriptional regulator [Capsulimonadaceae bacterium]|nr:LacI family DNA-binding transcriptional regulator [Capsulimonadaceae bacterium]
MTVTMKDIARRAGVSRQAVSAALGNSQSSIRVSDETRWRVAQVAQDLGYLPNSAARVMATGKFGCVAMLSSPLGRLSTVTTPFLCGIHDTLNTFDLHLLQAMIPADEAHRAQFVPKFLREYMIDGFLVNYVAEIPPTLKAAFDSRVQPCVWMNVDMPCDAVRPDDYTAARDLTGKLIELGHSRISFVAHHSDHYSVAMRRQGYSDAMLAAGLEPGSIYNVLGSRGWVALGREWLRSDDRPTAVVAYDSFTAKPILFAALMEGLRVPGDLSLATFDVDTAEDMTAGVKIAAMVVPWYSMGKSAVELLVEKIEQPDLSFPCRHISFTFDAGETLGPPR